MGPNFSQWYRRKLVNKEQVTGHDIQIVLRAMNKTTALKVQSGLEFCSRCGGHRQPQWGKTFKLSDGKDWRRAFQAEKQQVQRPWGRACLRNKWMARGSQGRESGAQVRNHHAGCSPQAEVGHRAMEAELHSFLLSLKPFIRWYFSGKDPGSAQYCWVHGGKGTLRCSCGVISASDMGQGKYSLK